VVIFNLFRVFDPILENTKSSFFIRSNTLESKIETSSCQDHLNLKKILIKKVSIFIWWKNFLCLEGALRRLVVNSLFFKKRSFTSQFLKKNLLSNMNITIFLINIFFSDFFFRKLFILKWLLYTVFTIKIYI
jgi:hypothetical protein